MTTTAQKTFKIMSPVTHDAIIDQLRSLQTSNEILEFEEWFNSNANGLRLYSVISEMLKNRSISRATAAKWFVTLIINRDNKIDRLKS